MINNTAMIKLLKPIRNLGVDFLKGTKSLDKDTKSNRLLKVIVAFFVLGITFILVAEVLLHGPGKEIEGFYYIFIQFLAELGIAFVIASIVAFVFEKYLSKERHIEMASLVGNYNEVHDYGFRKIFASRQVVFDELFEKSIPRAKHQIKIMGLCVSLFKEADRETRANTFSIEALKEILIKRIMEGCHIQVLCLKRYPTTKELANYGVSTDFDFFCMRERDEDKDENFLHGKRLKKIANRGHGEWIDILVSIAEAIKSPKFDVSERKKILNRLDIREYFALPSISLYIIDETIYVTPYLYKKQCDDVPAFKVADNNSPLFKSYDVHFLAAWENKDFTFEAIPARFIDYLAEEPDKTIDLYYDEHKRISQEHKKRHDIDPSFIEDPEFYRVEEKAIESVLKILHHKAKTIEHNKI